MNIKFLSASIVLMLFVLFNEVSAQEILNSDSQIKKLDDAIPLDPAVKTGKLSNGITYFIRKNSKPENKVELRLVVNTGSMLENEKQLGLAHFVEHMAFNGTKNFAKNELVSYLQSVGVKFGAHLNAYTSFDETVYMLNIPTADTVVDKGMQILEDWAHNISFEDDEIDKERGVVIEEWRLGQGAGQRMREKWFPVMMKDSRYAERLPIGKKEVLENFEYKTLTDFYKKWYRPELMAIVVVGDIDVDQMEASIKKHFNEIPKSKKPVERPYYDVPSHKESLVATAKDKEASFTQIQIIYKKDKTEVSTVGDYKASLVQNVYDGMFNQRLSELTQLAEPPFMYAGAGYGDLVRTKDAYSFFAIVPPNGVDQGITALLTENKRVLLHGFTESELDRYKKDMIAYYEKAYNERDKTESANYASEYISYFLEKVPAPGIGTELEYVKAFLPQITLKDINALTKSLITDDNRVIIVTGPDKENTIIPSEEEIEKIVAEADKVTPEAYEDNLTATALMEELPTSGTVKESKEKALDVTELTLSNGTKVVLKSTDFKNDQILMDAFNFGGHSVYPLEDYFSAIFAASIVNESGVKDFSVTDIQKLLTGKIANASPYIREITEGISGSATPKDLESMLQLVYLYFTAPRKDKEAFLSFINKTKAIYENLMASPDNYFYDQTSKLMSQNNPRRGGFPKQEDFDKVDLDRAYQIYTERYADAQNFTFFFVGNFSVEEITPLLEQYIGSLPTNDQNQTWKDLGISYPTGVIKKEFKKGTDQKSQVMLAFTGNFDYDKKEAYKISSLAEILDIKLTENLREDKSGVYGVSAYGSTQELPTGSYNLTIQFPCAPENVDKLIEAAFEEIKKIQENGPSEEDLNKIKETQKLEMKENLKKNNFWLSMLRNSYLYDRDYSEVMDYEKRIDALTTEDIKKTAQQYFNFENYVQAVLNPENID